MSDADDHANEAMDRYASGDAAAFRQLYDALAPRLYGFLLRLSGDPARAEDLLQQTFLQMHAARFRFVSGSPVAPWAMAIARRLFIDTVRENQRHATSPMDGQQLDETQASSEPSAEDWLSAREVATLLDGRLARLPAPQREALLLLKVEGLSVHDAAAVLGISIAALKVRAHRAYQRLRALTADVEKPR